MKTYKANSRDTFASIAKKFNVKDAHYLKTYHNLNCPIENVLHEEVIEGTEIVIPEDPEFLGNTDENDYFTEEPKNPSKETHSSSNNSSSTGSGGNESGKSEHDGKYFVIPKGLCQCNQGFTFPHPKVTSHKKHYINSPSNQADYLAVTEDDLTFDPASAPFGNCKLRPTSGGYLPCIYAPAGKWQKTYDQVKIMEKACVTEISELMCATGGKITILKHGQQSEAVASQFVKADAREQHVFNPLVDFEGFKNKVQKRDLGDYR